MGSIGGYQWHIEIRGHHALAGNEFPIPQTMAGVEIGVDSDEYQKWYRELTTFPAALISEAENKISEIINKCIEGEKMTISQEQG
jgi:hypothetical protein